jgi:hypothetical protein
MSHYVSMEKLAHLLNVDEVVATHGAKGYCLSVRIEKSWLAATIDKDVVEKEHDRTRVLAKHLSTLADTLRSWGKSRAMANLPIPQYQQPIPDYYARDRMIQRAQAPQPAPAPPPPSSTPQMSNRFEAIVAELKGL